jgi:hypothetical protein
MYKKLIIAVVLLLVLGLLVACGGSQPAGGIPDNAALKITGQVAKESGWTEESLKAMDTMQAEATNKKGETETYTGVSLNKLLEIVEVKPGASTLKFIADDGFTSEVPLADAQACQDCIVSFRSQGGFSMVMPGFDGKAQVKGVVEIQVQ